MTAFTAEHRKLVIALQAWCAKCGSRKDAAALGALLAAHDLATETWTDDRGTCWNPPTAWAYAQVCANRDALQADNVRLTEERTQWVRRAGILTAALGTIADFDTGNGDVCEIIARRARAALSAPAKGE